MFYNQTSLKGFSTFSTISLAFSIASVIPALLKPFIAISLSSLRVLHRSTIHFACSGLITESVTPWRYYISMVTRQLISQNWSVALTVVVKNKKKTSALTLILMNQLTWPLNNFLFLK